MIPIQVLGTGMIPRGYGLAPRKQPFMADRLLIGTIMATPGLTVNFVNPETGATTKLTSQNMDRIINKWSGWNSKKKATAKTQVPPMNRTVQQPAVNSVNMKQADQKAAENINHGEKDLPDPVSPQHVNTTTPPAVEVKADDEKPNPAAKKPADDKKDEEPVAETKTETSATDHKAEQTTTPSAQKNNTFKPVGQNNQNNQGKNSNKK